MRDERFYIEFIASDYLKGRDKKLKSKFNETSSTLRLVFHEKSLNHFLQWESWENNFIAIRIKFLSKLVQSKFSRLVLPFTN